MGFLTLYVKFSMRKRLTIGPDEYVQERAVKTFWKVLIAGADAQVLLPRPETTSKPRGPLNGVIFTTKYKPGIPSIS